MDSAASSPLWVRFKNATGTLRIFKCFEEYKIAKESTFSKKKIKLEWAASNGNRYPPYPQLMATAISQ